jgi:acetyl-CoA synthetase
MHDETKAILATEPTWFPSDEVIARANVTAVCRQLGLLDYRALHRWSIENREAYWKLVLERLGIKLRQPYERILDATSPTRPQWLVGARMNIIDSCFAADADAPAVIESDASGSLRVWTYGELRRLTMRVAASLVASQIRPGEAVGAIMPMSAQSVAIYLGIIAAGGAVVSIADSFAAEEISTRLRIANATMVFTQDVVAWGSKRLALYDKVVAAGAPMIIVVTTGESAAPLRRGDVLFEEFLRAKELASPVSCAPHDAINILFSSGTTGEPKAIPWDHTTPLKCAADAHFHQDIHPGDVACWPTSLGWMMGPWLIFAAMLNRATTALYAGAPTDAGFGRFVRDAGVTMLGLVPSLVRAWRQSGCMEGIDWSRIRAFSSSGECSNPGDMHWLMNLAGGRPIIEYCGGTEIGGGYVTGTVVQPCIPSAFTTPALGCDFVLLDEEGRTAEKGEAFIDGPSIGLSTRLLNRDHDAVYFKETPIGPSGMPLRRHGDELESLPGGYYRVAGRSDDTMNLGGIKVGCAEIERVLNALPGVRETSAVAVPPPGGGPSRLVVFLVQKEEAARSVEEWAPIFQKAIREQLNPLFRLHEVCLTDAMPRTASNKVMRRELRAKISTTDPPV